MTRKRRGRQPGRFGGWRRTCWILAAVVAGWLPAPTALAQPAAPAAPPRPATYVGSASCAGCHAQQFDAWRGSQHAHAMQEATEQTVLGDFGGAVAEHHGLKARFLRDGASFVAETEGKDGKTASFAVKYTFGVAPLQQYLVAFPDGRIQALPYAWDTRAKEAGGQRWFHLYPADPMPHTDPLFWTGPAQNWNFMCAECHSTNVRKNYDAARDTFRTTFSEIAVGCEGCHGPASGHLAWAQVGQPSAAAGKGFSSALPPRAAVAWEPDPRTGSPAASARQPVGGEVEMCGRCHARRGTISEDWRPGRPLADTHLPAFLTPDLFDDTGQMSDEVFNYASFLQSKMHAKGVVCSDCHEPHSGLLKAARAEVCAQCHAPQVFATQSHSGHAAGPAGPDCVSCHMPQRTYMVVDGRHDHSFRIPRPDLSVTLGTPNACNDCHSDKPPSWAASAVERWHGPRRLGFQTYAEGLHAARRERPDARDLLLEITTDSKVPSIARATALLELAALPSVDVERSMVSGLADADPMVRVAAVRGLAGLPLEQRWRRLNALLSDPVRAVRMEAAVALAEQRPEALSPADRDRFERALGEYIEGQRFNADRAESRSNVAGFLARRGRFAEAEAEYVAALRLQPGMTALHVNLSDLYRQQGRESEAEQLLRSAASLAPDAAAVRYALGLSLIRQKRYAEAVDQLDRAAKLAPDQARFSYVYAVALQSLGRGAESRSLLEGALARHPSDVDILTMLLQGSLQDRDPSRALGYAERLRVLRPDDIGIPRLIGQLRAAGAR